ncbi:MAG: Trp biosynthesis-associated membrane protein [Streptosporangiales bacterium]|nr:Trp biosynthesis-associated membrane protein [Streptosporangiales bacterium]
MTKAARSSSARREYSLALLAGAVGAGLIWLALRERWAQAVFTQPRPLPQQTVNVTGSDLVPLAGGLAIAALAGLAAIIATKGKWRSGIGVLVALFGAGAGAAVMTTVTAATVISVASSHVASPGSAAMSGAAGSTTGGSSVSGGSAVVVSGSHGQAILGGGQWQILVIVGALAIFAAGLATALRGADWPVMSSKYESPVGQRETAATGEPGAEMVPAGPADAASMWESLSGGEDPTGPTG